MKSFQIILAWSWLAILPITPSSAYDGLSPDPGSYRQGSAARRDDNRTSGYRSDPGGRTYGGSGSDAQDYGGSNYDNGQSSDWYSSDWYADQVGGRWRGGEKRWATPESSPGQGLESDYSDSDPGYGWRKYVPPGDHARVNEQPRYERPHDAAPRYRGDRDWEGRYDNAHRDQWAAPVQRPRYRFRDDPSFKNRGPATSGTNGYRFRPLTDKELERHRDSADVTQLPRSRRAQGRGSGSRSGEAFGYEPDVSSGSFYDRYYRSGPSNP